MSDIESVAEFIAALEDAPMARGHTRLFRGHDIKDLDAEPKVFRANHLNFEHRSIREFVSAFPQEFDRDATTLEKLVRAQHFGIPTRLLDLTWNPLIALYFACQARPNDDGEVICYTVSKSRIKYYDSDAVSCLSNSTYLTLSEKTELTDCVDDDFLDDVEEFNKLPATKPLLHYIRAEKPHFQPLIKPSHLMGMFFVKPKLNNRRILAQSGAFAIYGLRLPNSNRRRYDQQRYLIPAARKKPILATLSLLNIHNSSVFPEVENAASYIQSRM